MKPCKKKFKKIIEQHKTTIYAHVNLDPGLGQAQECGGD
jgi:hypothetical protein